MVLVWIETPTLPLDSYIMRLLLGLLFALLTGAHATALPELRRFRETSGEEPLAVKHSANGLMKAGHKLAALSNEVLDRDKELVFSIPKLEEDAEVVILNDEFRVIHVNSTIARTMDSLIMTTRELNHTIVKYQSNCRYGDDIHPLVRDFLFLQHLENLGVTPRALFLSPPVRVPSEVTRKTDFRLPQQDRAKCAARSDRHARFMLMENGGVSLAKLARKSSLPSLKNVVWMLSELIKAIEKIHDSGVIHGDVHWGNVVIQRDNAGLPQVKLIDFGSALFIDDTEDMPAISHKAWSFNPCFYSHWNIAGYRFGPRDDVFKAIMASAMWLNGVEYEQFCLALESDVAAMMEFKRDSFLFTVPGLPDRVSSVPTPDWRDDYRIRDSLERVLFLARSVNVVWDRPPYAEIVAELDDLHYFLGMLETWEMSFIL